MKYVMAVIVVVAVSGGSNWLSTYPDEMKLRDIPVFPGSLDSGMIWSRGWDVSNGMRQSKSILDQLNMGVRVLDFRVIYEKGEFRIAHSINGPRSYYSFEKRLLDVATFLDKNPREFVIIFLRNLGQESSLSDEAVTRLESELGRHGIRYATHVKKDGADISISGEVEISNLRGKVILVTDINVGTRFLGLKLSENVHVQPFSQKGTKEIVTMIPKDFFNEAIPLFLTNNAGKYRSDKLFCVLSLSLKQSFENLGDDETDAPVMSDSVDLNTYFTSQMKYLYAKNDIKPLAIIMMNFCQDNQCVGPRYIGTNLNNYMRDYDNSRPILSGIHLILGTRDSAIIQPEAAPSTRIGLISRAIFSSSPSIQTGGEYTQKLSIQDQLMNGIRAIDIHVRTKKIEKKKRKGYFGSETLQETVVEIVSSDGRHVSQINFETLLNQLVGFLSQPVHKTEFVFLFIRPIGEDKDSIATAVNEILEKHQGMLFQGNLGENRGVEEGESLINAKTTVGDVEGKIIIVSDLGLKHQTGFHMGSQTTTASVDVVKANFFKQGTPGHVTVESLDTFVQPPSFKEGSATGLNEAFLNWMVTNNAEVHIGNLHIVFMSFFNDVVVTSGEGDQSRKESQVLKALTVANPAPELV